MENTSLQKVLKRLTKQEWRDFRDFINSPYFNKNDKFRIFYDELAGYYPDFSIEENVKVEIFKKVTGTDRFNDASYRNLCSDLHELVFEFLTYEYMPRNNSNRQQFLAKALTDKKLYEQTEKVLKKVRSEISRDPYEELENLRTAIWLNDLEILLSIYTNRSRINASNEFMREDITYRVVGEWALLKVFNSLLNYMKSSRNLGLPPDQERIEAFLRLYEYLQPFSNPVTRIFYLLVRMTIYRDDANYFEAKKIFEENSGSIHSRNYENIMIGLLDYSNERVSLEESWRQELFELYDRKLKARLWVTNKDLSYASLYNAFINALQMERIDDARAIVEENIEYVHHDIRASIQQLCDAWIHYYNGNTDTAHASLALVETENLLIKYELRTLQALIYFAKKEFDVLASFLESFRHFIMYNKNSVDSSVTQQFGNFCKYLTALMKIQPYGKEKEIEKLRLQISEEPFLYMRKELIAATG